MTALDDNAEAAARARVEQRRAAGDPESLAAALEALARVAMKAADVEGAARALEEAGGIWSRLGRTEQTGSCLLLAASSYRLALQPEAARRALDAGLAADLPSRLRRGFEVEACEQELANGHAEEAWRKFSAFLAANGASLDPLVLAQILQRRAAAAIACERFSEGADDLMQASGIFHANPQHAADAEACALAAAGVLANVDNVAAERIIAEVARDVPADGGAAARRGLVGGKVALQAGDARLALQRFDDARQGALDAGDPMSYLVAAVEASHAAEALGTLTVAYARLATAWTTLSDRLGRDHAEQLVRPELEAFRNRVGAQPFAAAKQDYESQRRAARGERGVEGSGDL